MNDRKASIASPAPGGPKPGVAHSGGRSAYSPIGGLA